MQIDLARQVLEEKYPQYEWYAISGYSDKPTETDPIIFMTLNQKSSIARIYFNKQKIIIEKYDLTERTNKRIGKRLVVKDDETKNLPNFRINN